GVGILRGWVPRDPQRCQVRAMGWEEPASGFRLAERETILDVVQVRLAENCPGGLVVALRVFFLLIAMGKGQGQLPYLGTQCRRGVQELEDIAFAERFGKEEGEQAQRLASHDTL